MKTCIITGASSGIGRAGAVAIAELGEYDNIVLISRRKEELEKTRAMMCADATIDVVPFDVACIQDIPELIKNIYQQHGSIDCLLNVAGYTDPQFILETTEENLQKTFSVNVYAPYILCRECAKYMKSNRRTSKIINIASTAGNTPRPGWSVYAMSKAAVIEMSLTLAEELATYGIKVYCLSPGRCATELRRKLAPEEDQSKIMQPEAVGREIARMASENETCLDGQNIVLRQKF